MENPNSKTSTHNVLPEAAKLVVNTPEANANLKITVEEHHALVAEWMRSHADEEIRKLADDPGKVAEWLKENGWRIVLDDFEMCADAAVGGRAVQDQLLSFPKDTAED